MAQVTMLIFVLCLLVVAVNVPRMKREERTKLYACHGGDFSGQVHDIEDWRKIALELAKTVKNSKLNTAIKYGTDEDIIGLLYLNFGVELFDI